jgi:hypothetical protein
MSDEPMRTPTTNVQFLAIRRLGEEARRQGIVDSVRGAS